MTRQSQGKIIRVLIVDDSALIRKLLTAILNSDPDIEVVGTAADPYAAREKIKNLDPDVLTLDIEMPKMDGLTFLANLMRLRPMPVVMVSSLTQKGAETTFRALELGAVDFVGKPKVDLAQGLEACGEELILKVKAAAQARVDALLGTLRISSGQPTREVAATDPVVRKAGLRDTGQIIAIGSSTGGTEAIKVLLTQMRAATPGIVITQHIPAMFSASFAHRLDQCCEIRVQEAADGQVILPGHAFIAPGDQHLAVIRDGAQYRCRLDGGDPVNRHRPSVDVLFESVADSVADQAVGVILTGMGRDGAEGLSVMHDAGATTIAQDEETCVVWGMPRAAVEVGGVDCVLPLDQIAGKLKQICQSDSAYARTAVHV